MTENWAKICGSQADYTISKEDRRADRITNTEEGEEVGVSSGGVWQAIGFLLGWFFGGGWYGRQ